MGSIRGGRLIFTAADFSSKILVVVSRPQKPLLVQQNFLCDSIVIIGMVSMSTKKEMESTISEHYIEFQ